MTISGKHPPPPTAADIHPDAARLDHIVGQLQEVEPYGMVGYWADVAAAYERWRRAQPKGPSHE